MVLVPVVTLPKLKEVGVGVIKSVGETLVPARARTRGEVGALLTSVREPVKLPAEAGVNPMVRTEEPPAAMESGTVRPVKEKPVPESVAWVTLRLAVPAFLIVSD